MLSIFQAINLRLHADGGAASAAATGADAGSGEAATGEVNAQQSAAGIAHSKRAQEFYAKYVEKPTTQPAKSSDPAPEVQTEQKEQKKVSFQELIKSAEYKDEADKYIQSVLDRRFKSAKQAEADRAKLAPLIELLGKKYGQDVSDLSKVDLDALVGKIVDDDSYYEAEAMEKGVSVEQLKALKKMERENAELRKAMEERNRRDNAQRAYGELMRQAEETKAVYASFDLDAEMNNPRFAKLIGSGVDARTAFEVVHKDEIVPAAMQFAAQQTQQRIAAGIASGAKRPTEAGSGSAAPIVTKIDVTKLTSAQRREYIQKAKRGEKVTFT